MKSFSVSYDGSANQVRDFTGKVICLVPDRNWADLITTLLNNNQQLVDKQSSCISQKDVTLSIK